MRPTVLKVKVIRVFGTRESFVFPGRVSLVIRILQPYLIKLRDLISRLTIMRRISTLLPESLTSRSTSSPSIFPPYSQLRYSKPRRAAAPKTYPLFSSTAPRQELKCGEDHVRKAVRTAVYFAVHATKKAGVWG